MVENLLQERLVPARIERPGESHRLADAHPAVERMPLGQVGDSRPGFRPQFGGIFAEQFAVPVVGMGHAQEHFDGRRFARPVAAQQPVDRALRNAQFEIIDHRPPAVVFRESMRGDDVLHGSNAEGMKDEVLKYEVE